MDGYVYDLYEVVQVDSTTQEVITAGDYQGLIGFVDRYAITSRASSNRSSTAISREIQHQFIPLFQFGVFYDEDLEIYPGPEMTFEGRVHTNANLYMGAGTGITCNSYVTAGEQIWHHRKDGAHTDPPGYVRIKDNVNTYHDMWRGSYWLDNRRPDWDEEALTVWGGQVRDQSHGMSTLRDSACHLLQTSTRLLSGADTVNDGSQERESKYWYKAGRRYVDGVYTDSTGVCWSLQVHISHIPRNKYDDKRETGVMDVVDSNRLGRMVSDSVWPPNGMIYISDYRTANKVVRIKNGSRLAV